MNQNVLQEKLALGISREIPDLTPRSAATLELPDKARSIIGMRRAGKTFFLYQQMARQLNEGRQRHQLVYLNFEDERLPNLNADACTFLLDEYYRLHPEFRGTETVTWCLDEIQLVSGWESFVRRILDSEKVDVFISGSSAKMLSQEVATSMRGRALETVIYPFSFSECLSHAGSPIAAEIDVISPAERSRLEKALIDYLRDGGFPEAQGLSTTQRTALLRTYVDVALLRDIVERHNITNFIALRFLTRHLLAHAGRQFSIQKIHGLLATQGLPVAKNTLHEFLNHLEDAFLVRTVWMEATSERQRMVNPRKAYPVDPALIALFDRTGKPNTGHALETTVLIELERRGAEVTWVRTPGGYEIDFFARYPDGAEELIQVCADASSPDTAERELRALIDAHAAHPKSRRLLLTLSHNTLPVAPLPKGIELIPAWKWLSVSSSNLR